MVVKWDSDGERGGKIRLFHPTTFPPRFKIISYSSGMRKVLESAASSFLLGS